MNETEIKQLAFELLGIIHSQNELNSNLLALMMAADRIDPVRWAALLDAHHDTRVRILQLTARLGGGAFRGLLG